MDEPGAWDLGSKAVLSGNPPVQRASSYLAHLGFSCSGLEPFMVTLGVAPSACVPVTSVMGQ